MATYFLLWVISCYVSSKHQPLQTLVLNTVLKIFRIKYHAKMNITAWRNFLSLLLYMLNLKTLNKYLIYTINNADLSVVVIHVLFLAPKERHECKETFTSGKWSWFFISYKCYIETPAWGSITNILTINGFKSFSLQSCLWFETRE